MRNVYWFVLLWFVFAAKAMAAPAPVLVDADWVASHLNDADVVLVDTADGEQYSRFHLPGAVHIPYEALLTRVPRQPYATRLDDAALARLLGAAGIGRAHHVVIYDDVGGLNAGRLFWELERVGHPRVSVLDGGLVRWVLDGRKVVNGDTKRPAVAYRIEGSGRANEARLADVRQAVQAGDALLLDVRSEEEYVGAPRAPRSGHVPGAKWWPWEQAVDGAGGYVRRDPAALRRSLSQAGASDSKQPVIAYCRSGHRAAQTYLTLRSLGFDNVRLYPNSMLEYTADPQAPLRLGKQP